MQTRSPDRSFAAPDDLAACAALLRQGSRTFHAASLVLPRAVRDPATALYAFCRLADDAVDLGEGGGNDAVAALHARLDRAYAGHPLPIAADRAFAGAVRHFRIPRAVPEALLEGFAWDARGRRYETFSELVDYAVRVAGTVGAMMAALMGARAADVVARACDLGIAMQLTNIARDVGEDARNGRIYLPLVWLREAGIDPDAWLAQPVHSAALGDVVQRLLDEAEVLYERASGGIAALPAACRPGMHAARILYAEIGREVERRNGDSVSSRAVVARSRKLRCLASAGLAAVTVPRRTEAPCLPEARYLVEAVAATAEAHRREAAGNPIEKRVAWMVDLFDRLEREESMTGAASRTGSA